MPACESYMSWCESVAGTPSSVVSHEATDGRRSTFTLQQMTRIRRMLVILCKYIYIEVPIPKQSYNMPELEKMRVPLHCTPNALCTIGFKLPSRRLGKFRFQQLQVVGYEQC